MTAWPLVPIKDVARIVGGSTPKSGTAEFWDGHIPWATPKDLSDLNGKFIDDTPRRISQSGLNSCSSELLPPNSVLFSSRAPIGHVAINTVPMATNQGFKSFVPKPKIDASYLYWWLKCHRSDLERLGNGATFKEVSKAVVERIEIPLPPLEEQKRIAAILDQADDIRRKRQHAIDRLNQLGQAIFHEMFGDLEDGSVSIAQLGDLTSKIGSGATPKGGDSAYKAEGIPLVRSMNVRDGKFSSKGLAFIDGHQAAKLDNVVVQANDVLLNITGASVARVCRAPAEMAGARVNQHVSIIRLNKALTSEFLEAFLLMPRTKATLLAIAEAGATRQAITKTQIESLAVPLPSQTQQQEFTDRLKMAKQSLGGMVDQASAFGMLFASLQNRAFAGEL